MPALNLMRIALFVQK